MTDILHVTGMVQVWQAIQHLMVVDITEAKDTFEATAEKLYAVGEELGMKITSVLQTTTLMVEQTLIIEEMMMLTLR